MTSKNEQASGRSAILTAAMTGVGPYVLVLVLAVGLCGLRSGGVDVAGAQEPPADVVRDLERDINPRSAAVCPDPGSYSLTRPIGEPQEPASVLHSSLPGG